MADLVIPPLKVTRPLPTPGAPIPTSTEPATPTPIEDIDVNDYKNIIALRNNDEFMSKSPEVKREILRQYSDSFLMMNDDEQMNLINDVYGKITQGPQTLFEEMQYRSRPYTHTILPALGDIAATAGMAYATGGAAPTATLLGRLGKGALRLGQMSIASGAGSGAGELAAQVIGGEKVDPSRILEQAALGAGTETALGVAGAGVRGAGQLLRRTSLLGTFFEKQARDTAIKEAIKETEKAFSDYGLPRVGSKATAGIAVGEEFTKRLDFGTTFADYNKLLSSDWVGDTVQMGRTAEALKEMIESQKAISPKIGNKGALTKSLGLKSMDYRDVLERLAVNNELDTKTAKFLLDQVWKEGEHTFKQLLPAQDAARKKLKDALLYDLDNAAPGVWDLKEAADKYYGEAVSFLNTNRLAKQWMKPTRTGAALYEMRPEQFVDELFNANSVDELRNFKNVIQKTSEGKEAWGALKYHWIDDIYKRNMPVDKMSGETMLYPARLANELMAKQDMIARLMPEILPKVEKEIDKYIKMTPMFIKQTAEREGFWGSQRIAAPLMSGALSRYAIPFTESIGAISALSVTKPKLGKILKATEAGAKYTTKAAARIPQAFKEYEDNQTQ